MKFLLKSLLILTLSLAVSCRQKPARIVNHSRVIYAKGNELNKEKYQNSGSGFSQKKLSGKEIEVAAGDTLFSIAKENQVTLRDLIQQNNLSAPYSLKKGERLIIPSPKYHEVKSGETLYSISRLYDMKLDQLIEMNSLKEPYSVKVGERIRVSKFETSQVASQRVVPSTKSEAQTGFVERALDRFNHFSWPVRGMVVSKFGPKQGGLYNDGINIAAKEGEAVRASEDGVVAYVGNELKGYGNLVIIKHSGGWITAYAHLKDYAVKRGQKVEKGARVGSVGATGNVVSPQLYFGLRKGRDAVNPQNYLRS